MIPVSKQTQAEVSSVIQVRIGRLMSIADNRGCRIADLVAAGLDMVIEGGHLDELTSELRKQAVRPGGPSIEWTPEADALILSNAAARVGDRETAAVLGVSRSSVLNRRHWLESEGRDIA
jgi:hypothetical protein